MIEKAVKSVIFLGLLLMAVPASAEGPEVRQAVAVPSAKQGMADSDFARKPDEEIITSRGSVKAGMPKDKLYGIFQRQDKIFSHRILGGEWIVFRDWASASPKTDVITFYLVDGLVTGWKHAFAPSPTNEGSIYEYKKGEQIGQWFFPEGKSRWDGADMSMQEWNMLTDSQKVMFLTEYIKDLESKEGEHIAIDTAKYILALNYYADTCSTAYISQKITDVTKNLLASEGKIKSESKKLESPSMQHPAPQAE